MYEDVHASWTSLHGTDDYNPRDVQVWECGQGLQAVTGIYRDDGPKPATRRRLPDRPFSFLVPVDVDWRAVSLEAFYRLQDGRPLVNIDFRGCRRPAWPLT